MQKTGLWAHGKIGKRLENAAIRIETLEALRNALQVGQTYRIRTEHKEDGSGNLLFYDYKPMECVGTYPHVAVFRPVSGRHKFLVAHSYIELCRGCLKDVHLIMANLPEVADEEEEEEVLF